MQSLFVLILVIINLMRLSLFVRFVLFCLFLISFQWWRLGAIQDINHIFSTIVLRTILQKETAVLSGSEIYKLIRFILFKQDTLLWKPENQVEKKQNKH